MDASTGWAHIDEPKKALFFRRDDHRQYPIYPSDCDCVDCIWQEDHTELKNHPPWSLIDFQYLWNRLGFSRRLLLMKQADLLPTAGISIQGTRRFCKNLGDCKAAINLTFRRYVGNAGQRIIPHLRNCDMTLFTRCLYALTTDTRIPSESRSAIGFWDYRKQAKHPSGRPWSVLYRSYSKFSICSHETLKAAQATHVSINSQAPRCHQRWKRLSQWFIEPG